jgi:hypothetical protein
MIRHRYGGLADDVAGNEHRAQNPWSPWWPSQATAHTRQQSGRQLITP